MTSPMPDFADADQDLEVGSGFFSQELEAFLDEHPDVHADHVELARQSEKKRSSRRATRRPVVLPRPTSRP